MTRAFVGIGAAIVVALAALAPGLAVAPARAASPEPALDSSVIMSATPMLGGSYRPGTWMAVLVQVENNGPAIQGELRLSTTRSNLSTFSVAVELPSGSRQQHVVYGQAATFAGRYTLELLGGSTVVARTNVSIDTKTTRAPRVYVVAEHPERLVGGLTSALSVGGDEPIVVAMGIDGLPERGQAWSSIDLLVWQDVDSNQLDTERTDALRTWLATGGNLLILGGSTGPATLAGFPDELLPYRPAAILDVPPSDLEPAIGVLPAGTAPIPALAGSLARGSSLASSAGQVIAARAPAGRGSVTVVGFDPQTPSIAESSAAQATWRLAIPTITTAPDGATGDSFIVNALGDMPAVRLPDLSQLFVLMFGYVLALGPLNYIVLRRRDRRELAWITMPLTIGVFAVGAYLFGVGLRGSTVVVNELAIVHGAAGADRGMAKVYVGVFSPGRGSFDVRVGGRALLAGPDYQAQFDGQATPGLDVVQADESVVRRFGVSFGSLRAFTAQAEVATPRVDTELQVTGDTLSGTLTNSSPEALSGVSIIYGRAILYVGDMAPGETRTVELKPQNALDSSRLAERLAPTLQVSDADSARVVSARRAIIDHLDGAGGDLGFDKFGGPGTEMPPELSANGPIVVAWLSGSAVEVSVGSAAESIGERLYILPARASVSGPVAFSGALVRRTVSSVDASEYFEESGTAYLGRGTLAVEYGIAGLEGSFQPTALLFRLGASPGSIAATGTDLEPLPDAEQPDSDSPLAVNPRPGDAGANLPRIQLFDEAAQKWVEFEPVTRTQTLRVADPARWLDESGTLRVRFVVRGNETTQFSFDPRIEGTVE